jgi:hypothetical protein
MEHTLTGLADRPLDAQLVIGDLVDQCLCDRSDISLMAGDHPDGLAGALSGAPAKAASVAGQLAAAAASTAATVLSGLLGTASSATSRRISGMGVMNAVGELGTMLARTSLSTSADLARALADFGLDARLASEYSEALQSGKILIVVRARTDKIEQCARKVMATRGVLTEPSQAH